MRMIQSKGSKKAALPKFLSVTDSAAKHIDMLLWQALVSLTTVVSLLSQGLTS